MEEVFSRREGANERENLERRQGMASKFLAIEMGIADGPTVLLVARALPEVAARRSPTGRDREALAVFLRAQLQLS